MCDTSIVARLCKIEELLREADRELYRVGPDMYRFGSIDGISEEEITEVNARVRQLTEEVDALIPKVAPLVKAVAELIPDPDTADSL